MEKRPFALFIKYLKSRKRIIAAFLALIAVFCLTALIYRLFAEPIFYALEIVIIMALGFGTDDFFRFHKKHQLLSDLTRNITVAPDEFPDTDDLIESDYQQLVLALREELQKTRSDFDIRRSEMTDYYTLWAHQIKTPISALNLLLRSEEKNSSELEQELFKIEQYAEMVLCYLRSESLSADLILKLHSIDDMVRQAVKKYAVLFIGKKISLELGDLSARVVTDEKWFVFVIEQLLSNALKYTPENGKVSISLRETALIIEDNGIGILPEDLPRIFDRGFTGNNGRANKKSTGIGLYLCKRILAELNHKISAESVVGSGTRLMIELSNLTKM